MEELDINASLVKDDLFALFKQQLQKDVEGAGINAGFVSRLPAQFDELKKQLVGLLQSLSQTSASLLSSLLYRVDISEAQLKKYGQEHANMGFEEVVAELIIKRVLQKVILRKRFSE